MHRSLLFLVVAACVVACHVDGKVNASASANESSAEASGSVESSEPAQSQPAETAAAVQSQPAAPASTCPLDCYEARGPVRATLTAEEQSQLRSSLEPVLSRMRGCESSDAWRRYGSPVLNLRIAPDGTLADLGVDPHHGSPSSCFAESERTSNVSVSLPGRHVVRCAERCVRERAPAQQRAVRRRR